VVGLAARSSAGPSVQGDKGSIKLKTCASVKRFRKNLFAGPTPSFLFFSPAIPANRPGMGKSREQYLLADARQELFWEIFGGGVLGWAERGDL